MNDLISRQLAIDAALTFLVEYCGAAFDEDMQKMLCERLDAIPSAEPERKKGKFLGTEYDGFSDGEPVFYEWQCSECGWVFEEDEPTYYFCPNCGAEMK